MTVLACDLGATRLKIGLVRKAQVLAQKLEPSHSNGSLAGRLPMLKSTWLKLLAEHGLSLADCSGVSVAFPSLVNPKTGRVLAHYGRFTDAPDVDMRSWALQELGLPLAIENDARMALIGEWQAGAGRGVENLVMITLGTGVGTSAIIQGQVLRGKHGQAGVLGGHLTLRYGGRSCNCGNLGCAEAEASTAFLREMAANLCEFEHSSMRNSAVLDYATVFEHAAAGDASAVALRDHSLRVWSALAVNLIHTYDPEVLILGGGIMASARSILPTVTEHVRRHAHTPWGQVRVMASQLGEQAALVAAEWLLREQLGVGTLPRNSKPSLKLSTFDEKAQLR